ncbi:hypothetical protein C0991_012472 [Blastosporella zonata]|nr:hypothetical protein C0991_012472 [Blastosporella zonata]
MHPFEPPPQFSTPEEPIKEAPINRMTVPIPTTALRTDMVREKQPPKQMSLKGKFRLYTLHQKPIK